MPVGENVSRPWNSCSLGAPARSPPLLLASALGVGANSDRSISKPAKAIVCVRCCAAALDIGGVLGAATMSAAGGGVCLTRSVASRTRGSLNRSAGGRGATVRARAVCVSIVAGPPIGLIAKTCVVPLAEVAATYRLPWLNEMSVINLSDVPQRSWYKCRAVPFCVVDGATANTSTSLPLCVAVASSVPLGLNWTRESDCLLAWNMTTLGCARTGSCAAPTVKSTIHTVPWSLLSGGGGAAWAAGVDMTLTTCLATRSPSIAEYSQALLYSVAPMDASLPFSDESASASSWRGISPTALSGSVVANASHRAPSDITAAPVCGSGLTHEKLCTSL
eukprot:Unigene4466_Nuclearia_a/m.13646 Unigene4466_Nuclearia_a/g.13646  ORF Unigene4466_Nuclearia_a/g.13646 Unigene4466_Nuclearia_a/m.13646 type:complete len:334 (+) Unigene4466_Nuclearia_a:923-1924(+)